MILLEHNITNYKTSTSFFSNDPAITHYYIICQLVSIYDYTQCYNVLCTYI